MAYSFTEKKRIRKNFGNRPSILGVPPLLAIQTESYATFLQIEESRRLHDVLRGGDEARAAGGSGQLLSEAEERAVIARSLKRAGRTGGTGPRQSVHQEKRPEHPSGENGDQQSRNVRPPQERLDTGGAD